LIAAFAKGIFDSEIKVGFYLSYGDRVMYDKKMLNICWSFCWTLTGASTAMKRDIG
jgi:hypothetical protein